MSQPLKYLCHHDLAKVSSGELRNTDRRTPGFVQGFDLSVQPHLQQSFYVPLQRRVQLEIFSC